ncbi:hypothetical protein J421_5348 (plasmid) [Gemmatirosa kalamazoonensis]|uniref:Uncharacterized protein n=1 Tax=Gemmatirosa kalamazoonensis TaxID=861299 RepID=W0RTH0_9BACT|nr:hypothetical protein [Gemmatirosa kalamazoonensis]AHG92883.1 hypothetical protein J421_5348 [Gemmatirosa kalamazoonensis]
MKISLALSLILVATSWTYVPTVTAQSVSHRRLSEAEACTLARSVNGRPVSLPRLVCEPQALAGAPSIGYPEWFVAYQLIVPETSGGTSVNRGFYAVNRVTGDTWELVLCEHVSSTAIRRAQARLRRESGLSRVAWARAARERPCESV